MNVFDFDGTIYDGDSETDFFFYCFSKYPKVRKHIFPCMGYGILYFLHVVNKTSERIKREIIRKACLWLEVRSEYQFTDSFINSFKEYLENEN